MTKNSDTQNLDHLTILGNKAQPSRVLETFPNQHQERNYTITMHTREFTCLCPVTAQPDFATLTISYIPDARIVESKSLKLYLWSFRDEGIFHEHVCNTILDCLVDTIKPRWCEVTADFSKRGGISISVNAEHGTAH